MQVWSEHAYLDCIVLEVVSIFTDQSNVMERLMVHETSDRRQGGDPISSCIAVTCPVQYSTSLTPR